MKKYDNYKDSGLEWIGEIPEHWSITKIKNISELFGRIGFRGYTVEDIVEKGQGAISLSPSNIFEQKLILDKGTYISWEKYNESPEIQIYNNDVILVKTASVGKVGFIENLNEPATLNPQLVVFKNVKLDNKYLYYLLISEVIQTQIKSDLVGGVVPTISQSIIKNYYIPICKIEEQTAIANYLDRKTTQIDTLITKKEQFISLLQEERTAVINQAVTKGLDPKVKMKDSGIEWLGEIPEHWEVKKLKFVSKITRGAILRPVDEPSYFDDNGEWTYLNISDATICDKYLDYGKLRLSELGSTKSARVEPNNLIITASATIGKPFINKIPVCVHDGFIPITELKVNIDFLYNYFKNPQLFNGLGKSNTQKNIYLEDVKNLIIPIPNLEEQLLIARYIEEEIIRIETLISKSLQEIELLKEYKTALISEVVTGKVDVRDVVLN